MTTRTLVSYLVALWSKLGMGVAKDKITLSPSTLDPAIPAQKNWGALSPNIEFLRGIENNKNLSELNRGIESYKKSEASDYSQADSSAQKTSQKFIESLSVLAYPIVADRNFMAISESINKWKFKKQIATFNRLKEKRKLRLS